MINNNDKSSSQLVHLDQKIERFEDKVTEGLKDVKVDVKDIKDDIKDIKHDLTSVEKAEQTLFKLFAGIHKKLMGLSNLYYKWHMWPYSRKIHWVTLILYIIVIILLIIINLYFQPRTLTQAAAGINKMVSYQGKLTDENDIPVPDGSYNLKVSIYDALTDGSCLWTWKGSCVGVTAVPVTVTDGIFNVMLGDSSYQTTNTLTLDFNADTYYMGVTVGADAEMSPRKRIGAAGYAYNSDTLDSFHASSTATASYLLPLDANVDFALPDDSKVVFRDSGIYLQSSADGKLLISSDGASTDDISLSGSITTNDNLIVADDKWLGLGSGAGQIEFDNQSTNEVNILYANVGIGTQTPGQKLTVAGTLGILETGASPTYYTIIQGGDQTGSDITYTLPTAAPAVTGYVLSATTGGVMSWVVQSGGTGDITDVGSMSTGAAFADATADDDWLGLGASAGRIVFDDQTTDYVNILTANVGIGTSTPNELLTVEGTLSLVEQTSSDTATSGYGKIYAKKPATIGIDSYTKLLLHTDGTDGSTTFTDSEITPKTITANGNAQIDTAQSKFGGASGLFDGNGDYVSALTSTDFNFGTGDFTIDFWTRLSSIATQSFVTADWYSGGWNGYWGVYMYSDGNLAFGRVGTDEVATINTPLTSTNQWYHIAVARTGTTLNLFVDGVLKKTATYSADLTGNDGIFIGGNNSTWVNGWIEELRVSKGIARWTDTFTPPASAYSADIYDLYYVDSQGSESVLSAWNQNAIGDEISYTGNIGVGVADPIAHLEVEVGSTDALTGLLVDQQDLDQIALQLTSSTNATATMFDLATNNISGDLINIDWDGGTSATGDIIGNDIDLTNLTPTNNGANYAYGVSIKAPAANNSSNAYGLYVQGTNWDYGLYNADDTYLVGNVGINTSPSAKLDILYNTTGSTTANNKVITANTTSATFSTAGGALTNYGAYFTNTATKSAGTDPLTNVALYLAASGADTYYALITNGGNVGIGTTAPTALLSVAEKFLVDTNGNITKINNIAYSWPASQGAANTVLTNNGSGTLSWSSSPASGKGQFSNLRTNNYQTDSYTKLLLQANGTDAATTFYDSALGNKTITTYDTTQIDTAQSKFGGTSALFDGSSDLFTAPSSTDFDFGAGDFTIDFWMRPNVIPSSGSQDIVISRGALTGWYLAFQPDGTTMYWAARDNAAHISFSHGMSTGNWYHMAIVCNSGTTTVYINGVSKGTTVTAVRDVSVPITIGNWDYNTSTYGFNGWLDEFRVSKGVARWTTNFTAPTAKYNSSGDEIAVTATSLVVADTTNDLIELLDVNLTSIDIIASGANGLDTGSEAVGWYYIWVIYNGSTASGLLSTSSTSPTMPGGYTYKALVGAVYNDSDKNLYRYYQYNGNVRYISAILALNNGIATTYTSVSLLTCGVPANATEALIFGYGVPISTNVNKTTFNISADGTNVYTSLSAYYYATSTFYYEDSQQFTIPLITSQIIYYYATISNSGLYLYVQGYTLNL